jgi:uncharacterized membrane protein
VQLFESFPATVLWRMVSGLGLLWLAIFFARTLRTGQVPLIQRIARASDAALAPELCRYTRRLTAIWSAHFGAAAALILFAATRSSPGGTPFDWAGSIVWSGTFVLFVGEHRLRRHLFPAKKFPGLWQQVQDTWSVWHPVR